MTEHHLSLRPIDENDYGVMREGRAIGRIRLADATPGRETWHYNITVPLPVPSYSAGDAGSMEAAKTAFRAAWEQCHATLTPDDVEHWHSVQDAADRRYPRR